MKSSQTIVKVEFSVPFSQKQSRNIKFQELQIIRKMKEMTHLKKNSTNLKITPVLQTLKERVLIQALLLKKLIPMKLSNSSKP